MSELTLIVEGRNSRLEIDGKSLVHRPPNRPMQRYPLGLLNSVIVQGNCHLNTQVFRTLAERNIAMAMLPSRGTGQCALNVPAITGSATMRQRQHQACAQQKLDMAALIVAHKLQAYAKLEERLVGTPALAEANNLSAVEKPQSISELMGVEGAKARHWFQTMAKQLPANWAFNGRNRRPPKDPINAMLSLGYALLNATINQGVLATGLDPAQGLLHQNYPGRLALVLDMAEPFRAGVDDFVIQLTKHLAPDDFTFSDREGCRLNKEAASHFYRCWASHTRHWPDWLSVITETQCATNNGLLANVKRYCKNIETQLINTHNSGGVGDDEH